jgi:hypothetical protein
MDRQMPTSSRYTLIKGNFWIHYPDHPRQGPEPDGDTVSFAADDLALVRSLHWHSGHGPNINARGIIPVRYEGIDALETHFRGAHQQMQFARAARDENLRLLGFTNVVFFPDLPNKVSSVDVNPLPGYVLANGIEANGRLLGLVYAGDAAMADGSQPFVDEAMLGQSINAKLVAAGLAYVEPYDSMPIALVRHLRTIIATARQANTGLLGMENVSKTQTGRVPDLATLQTLIMWPKLFRRLTAYFAEGFNGLGQFDNWVRLDPINRDDSLRLPDGELGNMHDTYRVVGDTMTLAYNPEELLIAPDPSPMGAMSALMTPAFLASRGL